MRVNGWVGRVVGMKAKKTTKHRYPRVGFDAFSFASVALAASSGRLPMAAFAGGVLIWVLGSNHDR